VKLFVAITFSLPLIEFMGLLDLGALPSKLDIYDPMQLSAWRVPAGLLAWPAEFVACYHPKHIFMPKKAPTMEHLSKQLTSLRMPLKTHGVI
jgi:hypothetical protein